MRNALISNDTAAQNAGQLILAEGGTAADAVIAATFAGAARASAASLLGGALFAVAGPGVGAWVVDGRARAPGKGEQRRKSVPEDPPASWSASVPGLVEGALATHVRFGVMGLGTLIRTMVSSVKDSDDSKEVRARLTLVEALPRHGMGSLARLGVQQMVLEQFGPAAGGVLTREDFEPQTARIEPLAVTDAGPHEILTAPVDPPAKHAPPAPPVPIVGAALAADMHGVVACAVWAVAPEAAPLASETGLAWPGLGKAPSKGVTRWRAGAPLPLPAPFAILRNGGRAWAGASVAGAGDLDAVRDGLLRQRLAMAGVPYGEEPAKRPSAQALTLWAVREGDEVRTFPEAYNG